MKKKAKGIFVITKRTEKSVASFPTMLLQVDRKLCKGSKDNILCCDSFNEINKAILRLDNPKQQHKNNRRFHI